ncbi:unnamed protein product [Symbiodinium sp. CCMP2456]|nr:unnamed protein product [Symbiodinium sp. CCMP2456]
MARFESFLVLAASCAVAADAATITTVYPNRGSTEGGTYLVISGSGFMMPTEANPWDSQVVYVGSKICNIMAHYTSSTQIVCMTTPHDVVAESSESLTVSVQIFGGLGLASYASKSSAFQYHWQDTAIIHWANHWAGTGGDIMEFGGDIPAGATSAGQFEIRVGDAWCHVDEEVWPLSNRRRSWTKQVSCQLPDDDLLIPGYYNVSIRVNSLDRADGDCPNSLCFPYTEEQAGTRFGHGFAAIVNPPPSSSNGKLNRVWGGMLDIVTGHTYHFTVYPQVNSIEPLEGGLYGGNNLTIHGSSFAAEMEGNQVTVGGVPCEVLEATTDTIVCRLGQWNDAADRGETVRGLHYNRWNDRRRRAWGINNIPAKEARGDAFETGFLKASLFQVATKEPWDNDPGIDRTLLELDGFFVPPLEANYSFYICGLGLSVLGVFQRLRDDFAFLLASHRYFHEDVASGDFTGNDKKISDDVLLTAGEQRNSLLSGLWQAAEAGLVDEELPFSAVTVNLPNLSAPIHTTVQSSKEYVRGSEHVSTHSGISLVSTEKRKALLSTLEDGARYTQRFKDCCRRKYGKLVVAWRILLDPGGNGRVSFVPFCNAARAMGFVNVSTLWRHLDVKCTGFLTLDSWDPHSYRVLMEFREICRSEFGGVVEAFKFGMNRTGSGACYKKEFEQFLKNFEFSGDYQMLWDALDKDRGGFITVDELFFLARWQGERFRPDKVQREFNLNLVRLKMCKQQRQKHQARMNEFKARIEDEQQVLERNRSLRIAAKQHVRLTTEQVRSAEEEAFPVPLEASLRNRSQLDPLWHEGGVTVSRWAGFRVAVVSGGCWPEYGHYGQCRLQMSLSQAAFDFARPLLGLECRSSSLERLHDCRSVSGDDDESVGQTNWIRMEVYDAGAGGATVGDLPPTRPDSLSWSRLAEGEQFQLLVRFRRPIGNVPELELNTTGLLGSGFQLQVFTLEDGDADAIFLEKVPLDMFQVPRPSDAAAKPVRVISEGVLGYTYSSSLVPVLHSAMPSSVTADDNLQAPHTWTLVISNIQTYNSTGWIQDLQVLLGEDAGQCKDLHEVSEEQGNITVICRLENARAGEPEPWHAVHLISISQGQADPSKAPIVSVEPVIEEVTGLLGSLAGGTVRSSPLLARGCVDCLDLGRDRAAQRNAPVTLSQPPVGAATVRRSARV